MTRTLLDSSVKFQVHVINLLVTPDGIIIRTKCNLLLKFYLEFREGKVNTKDLSSLMYRFRHKRSCLLEGSTWGPFLQGIKRVGICKLEFLGVSRVIYESKRNSLREKDVCV